MFNFTSLLGARTSSLASQSLLDLEGGVKILVDAGWDESFNSSLLKELEQQVSSISLVLLTHATTSHIGAFAHCCKHFVGFKNIPIYATAPVISLGRALLQDIYKSNPLAASTIPASALSEPSLASSHILLQPPTTDEIAEYFSFVRPLKFSQPHEPEASVSSPPLNGLSITAYSAGHSLGGTIWHIQHGLESIVYAVDWNQTKESALQAAAWLTSGGTEVIESLRRPTALICSSRCSQRVLLSGGRQSRDEQMLKLIRETISNGGSVLIPTDTCARSLELSYFLEEKWDKDTASAKSPDSLKVAQLYFASKSAGLTMRYARSMLEWMDDEIIREFEAAGQPGGHRRNDASVPIAPFDFKHIRVVEKTKQIQRMLARHGPKVILTSDLSLQWGSARHTFELFCADNRNLVILPEPLIYTKSGSENLGHKLWNMWSSKSNVKANEKNLTAVVDGLGERLSYSTYQLEQLDENESRTHQQYLSKEKQKQWVLTGDQSVNIRTSTTEAIDENASSSSDESDESDGEQQGKVLNVSATLTHARNKAGLTDAELGIDVLVRRRGHYDWDVRGKKGRERIFPIMPVRRNQKFDDYGEVIRPEDFLRAEERETAAEQTASKTEKETSLGQKRKWGELSQTISTPKPISNGPKKRKMDRAQDDNQHTDSGYSTLGNGQDSDADSDDTDDDDDEAEASDGPVKVVFSTKSIAVQLRLAYVDFTGLHDRRSMQMLIPLIRPRKLVLVGGNSDETAALQDECEKLLNAGINGSDSTTEIFTPNVGETLDASVDTNAWNVKLGVLLRNTLKWQHVGGLEIVPLTGHLGAVPYAIHVRDESKRAKIEQEITIKTEEPVENKQEVIEAETVLDIVSSASSLTSTRIFARPLHVGDVRLSDLRKAIQSAGIGAEFRGEGVLLVNGQVAVRKSAIGKIEVESVIGLPGYSVTDPTFDIVRRNIYESLALISGGSG